MAKKYLDLSCKIRVTRNPKGALYGSGRYEFETTLGEAIENRDLATSQGTMAVSADVLGTDGAALGGLQSDVNGRFFVYVEEEWEREMHEKLMDEAAIEHE